MRNRFFSTRFAGSYSTFFLILAISNVSIAQVRTINRVSTDGANQQSNGASTEPILSQDGRYVVFSSAASNLISADTGGKTDVFLKDLQTGAVQRISTVAGGGGGDGDSPPSSDSSSHRLSLSPDGRFVTFVSSATNLVSRDTNGLADVFVFDRQASSNGMSRSNLGPAGVQADAITQQPSISDDGNIVAFVSSASNLILNDGNGLADVFLRDVGKATTVRIVQSVTEGDPNGATSEAVISGDGAYVAFTSFANNLESTATGGFANVYTVEVATGTVKRVSKGFAGAIVNGGSFDPAISRDGRYVAFVSDANNLVSGDSNAVRDVFVWDRTTDTTKLVTVSSIGKIANAGSVSAAVNDGIGISADGRYIVYRSSATNLVPNDRNKVDDIFLYDQQDAATGILSRNVLGVQGDGIASFPKISADGSVVTFSSTGVNLVSGDTNGQSDVFVAEPGSLPEIFTPNVVLEESPIIVVANFSVTVVMKQFPAFKTTAAATVAGAAKRIKPTIMYNVILTRSDSTQSTFRRRLSKRNSTTFKRIPAGNYVAKYTAVLRRGKRTIGKSTVSPGEVFTVG